VDKPKWADELIQHQKTLKEGNSKRRNRVINKGTRLTTRFDSPETDELIKQLRTEGIEVETGIEPDDFDGESDYLVLFVDDYQKAFLILESFEKIENSEDEE
jgi:hypothetical protein